MHMLYLKSAYALVGLLSGSFLLALADRSIDKTYKKKLTKLLTAPSHCDSCGKPVGFIGLIPVLGFILQGGRCRHCSKAISIRYPLAELAGAALAVLVFSRFGLSVESALLFFSICVGIAISYADLRSMTVPDILNAALIPGALISIIYPEFTLDALLGGLVVGAVFFAALILFPGGFGGGDFKYAALLGFYTGLRLAPVMGEAALVSGSLVGVLYGLISQKGLRIKMPFAPFITFGYIVTVLFGDDILLFYGSFF